jgi:D-amino-acid dehydrogenase
MITAPKSPSKNTDILIIGGGVIGVCCAHYLSEAGAQVVLIERDEIASGSSYGNAGLYVPSHSIPLAAPGALRAGLRWMLDPESPFYVRPRLAPDLWAWILRFGLASREVPMRRAIPILRDLGLASGLLYRELATLEGPGFDYGQAGLLTVFRTTQGLRHGLEEAALLREFGLRAEVVDAGRARVIEPALRGGSGGSLPDDAHMTPPRPALAGAAGGPGPQTRPLGFDRGNGSSPSDDREGWRGPGGAGCRRVDAGRRA